MNMTFDNTMDSKKRFVEKNGICIPALDLENMQKSDV